VFIFTVFGALLNANEELNTLFLTPKDIHDKTFKRSFKGYDENEVDEFLDLIIKEFNMLIDENERLRQDIVSKPAGAGQENSGAPLNEIMRLEGMLMQVIDNLQKSPPQAAEPAPAYQERRAHEDYEEKLRQDEAAAAKALEQQRKLEEFRNALEMSKTNFEQLIEEQKSLLNQKYSEIIQELGSDTPAGGEVPEQAHGILDMPAEPVVEPKPVSFEPAQPEIPQPEPEKPRFLSKPIYPLQDAPAEPQAPVREEKPPAFTPQPAHEPQQPAFTPQPAHEPQQPAFAQAPPAVERQPYGYQQAPAETAAAERPNFLQRPPQHAQNPEEQPAISRTPAAGPPASETSPGSSYSIRRGNEEQSGMQADNRFRPNYSEYEWLYKEKDLGDFNTETGANFDITFRNPREKEELKRLIDEVID
jgi:cell division initiation protein